jgi:UDP-2-acetamido-2-deoxy-ribo-hexuluronate aminotransferase
MEFVDLAAQQRRIAPDLDARLRRVLAHGQYIMGPEVGELEERLAAYAGAAHCIACANGTDALLIGLLAHGIGPGDAVFTSPFTFMATAEVVVLAGATPVFVDVDPVTYNLDAALLETAVAEVSAGRLPPGAGGGALRPRAVIPVDLYGLPADYRAIGAVAARHDLVVIEDGAQSFGGEQDGVKTGALAPLATTSFFPAKPLGCYGDGGAVFARDAGLAEVLRSLTLHGRGGHKYHNVRVGMNSRLDTLQAAILLAKLEVFPDELELRQMVADRYTELLAGLVQVPRVPPDRRSAWAQYAVMLERRDEVAGALRRAGVPTAVYYPVPLHLQPVLSDLGYGPGALPVAEELSARVLCLPMHPYLEVEQQRRVAAELERALQEVRA